VEHFEATLNHPPGSRDQSLDNESICAVAYTSVHTDKPKLDEVIQEAKKLKNGCAPWTDGISAELLMCAIGPVSRALHMIFCSVWQTGQVPSDWKDRRTVSFISLYKGKGSKNTFSNYRPITLLSVPGKVFAHVILACIQPFLDSARRPQQSGFTTDWSTIDAILALRLLSELHREFDHPLDVAFLDIKAVFDFVDRIALWKTLCSKGVLPIPSDLIAALHESTGAQVRVGQQLSDIWALSLVLLPYALTATSLSP